MVKKISLAIMSVFYLLAGVNHFLHPDSYYALIPPYLPFHYLINIASGMAEITFGGLLLFPATRNAGIYGVIALLILFIPAHIYMIQQGGCMSVLLCVPAWVAWVRLFPLQFVLIAWARWYAK
jgi:uncharacterized membrane protein